MFVIMAKDYQNSSDKRNQLRAQHVDYLNRHEKIVKIAGPLMHGNEMIGSLLVVDLPIKEEVLSFLENDPYSKGGLFENVIVEEFNLVIKNV